MVSKIGHFVFKKHLTLKITRQFPRFQNLVLVITILFMFESYHFNFFQPARKITFYIKIKFWNPEQLHFIKYIFFKLCHLLWICAVLDLSLCHRKAKSNTKPHHTGCEYLILKFKCTCELAWQNNPGFFWDFISFFKIFSLLEWTF